VIGKKDDPNGNINGAYLKRKSNENTYDTINSNGLNVNENSQINNSNHLLHKLTHSTFHSSTFKNLIYEGSRPKESYNSSEKNDLYYNQGMENEVNYRKRNNSDNNKNIINHSFKKFENFGKKGMKLLFKYCKNNKENINNINNSAMPSFHQNIPKYQQLNNSNYLNKNKKALYIKLNKGLDNSNPTINSSNYLTTINYQGINKPINYDFGEIKQIKTEYNINNIEEYKKGNLYEYNSNILYTDTKGNSGKSKDFKVQFCENESILEAPVVSPCTNENSSSKSDSSITDSSKSHSSKSDSSKSDASELHSSKSDSSPSASLKTESIESASFSLPSVFLIVLFISILLAFI